MSILVFIRSPELIIKALVSFSDRLLSVVYLSVRPLILLLTVNIFIFQPNLAQNILQWCVFIFVKMKDPAFFHGEKIRKKEIALTKLRNLLLQYHLVNFNLTWHRLLFIPLELFLRGAIWQMSPLLFKQQFFAPPPHKKKMKKRY